MHILQTINFWQGFEKQGAKRRKKKKPVSQEEIPQEPNQRSIVIAPPVNQLPEEITRYSTPAPDPGKPVKRNKNESNLIAGGIGTAGTAMLGSTEGNNNAYPANYY